MQFQEMAINRRQHLGTSMQIKKTWVLAPVVSRNGLRGLSTAQEPGSDLGQSSVLCTNLVLQKHKSMQRKGHISEPPYPKDVEFFRLRFRFCSGPAVCCNQYSPG